MVGFGLAFATQSIGTPPEVVNLVGRLIEASQLYIIICEVEHTAQE